MIKTSGNRNLNRKFPNDDRRDGRDSERSPAVGRAARFSKEPCVKMLGVDTLEIMPPIDDEKMPMKGVECVQVVIPKAKIVALAHIPGQVRGECRSKLRI